MRVFAESRYDPTSGNDTENKYSISDALRSLPQCSALKGLFAGVGKIFLIEKIFAKHGVAILFEERFIGRELHS